ncbi:MAG: sensor histidine kinase [Balneolaceae bacterium]|nr:sensor histidine kinase [Balneolaceae bacterium]
MKAKTKAAIILTLIFIAFISDLIENNINATGISLIILIPFLSILLYQLRTTLLIFGLSLVTYSVIAYLYLNGHIINNDYQVDLYTATDWINHVSTDILIALVISIFVYSYNESVEKFIVKLETANSQLKQRDDQLEESLDEKDVLLQEIHHRVKNNLAVVSGLLELQSYSIDDQKSKYVLRKSTNRIMSIAKVHEMLYESKNFTKIPFQRYIDELTTVIFDSMDQYIDGVSLQTNIDIEYIGINHGVPLGIIFNELITNSIKYGFKNKSDGQITIDVSKDDEHINVCYQDNGIGIEDFETASRKSLGFTLIESLMGQIDATYTFETENKFKLNFYFPIAAQ